MLILRRVECCDEIDMAQNKHAALQCNEFRVTAEPGNYPSQKEGYTASPNACQGST